MRVVTAQRSRDGSRRGAAEYDAKTGRQNIGENELDPCVPGFWIRQPVRTVVHEFLIPLPTLMSLIVHGIGEARVERFRFLSQNVGADK
jgi:hypothetical protein